MKSLIIWFDVLEDGTVTTRTAIVTNAVVTFRRSDQYPYLKSYCKCEPTQIFQDAKDLYGHIAICFEQCVRFIDFRCFHNNGRAAALVQSLIETAGQKRRRQYAIRPLRGF